MWRTINWLDSRSFCQIAIRLNLLPDLFPRFSAIRCKFDPDQEIWDSFQDCCMEARFNFIECMTCFIIQLNDVDREIR